MLITNIRLIRCWYFSITTLSTVGYGDLHPRSDIERVAASIILLIGVAVFSLIMSDFIEILNSYREKMFQKDMTSDLAGYM